MSESNFLSRMWRGEEKLWKAFWLWPIVIGLILAVIVYGIGVFTGKGYFGIIATPAYNVAMAVYWVWLTIAVWRCGKNSKAIWRVLSRIVMVLGTAAMLFVAAQSILSPQPAMNPFAQLEKGIPAAPVAATSPVAEPVTVPAAAPAAPAAAPAGTPATAPVADKAVECGKRFDDYYRENKLDPNAYPNEKADYMTKCAVEVK